MTWHAFASYKDGARIRTALVLGETLFDLEAVAKRFAMLSDDAIALQKLDTIIDEWDRLEDPLSALAEMAAKDPASLSAIAGGDSRLALPFKPFRVLCTASNYIEHAAEMQTKLAAKADSMPFVFMKSPTCAIAPEDSVVLPLESQRVDWEVELAAVIARPGRRISAEKALDYIAGYTVVNDISARDMIRRTDFPFSHDWFRCKSFETFLPMGPWFVPRRCIKDPHNLRLSLHVNDIARQDGNTEGMIFNTFEQIEYLSRLMTLYPRDVLATGTPAGVGQGKGIYLAAGDTMVAAVEGIGTLRNPVVAEVA